MLASDWDLVRDSSDTTLQMKSKATRDQNSVLVKKMTAGVMVEDAATVVAGMKVRPHCF